ncbi:Putative methylesterase 6 [Vanrija pseudolonga]|uniref:Methylesterase 6 n=1 Tax=Vanrija pseudolonga TaxID=143232 RepID=A0AAF0Y213_9TREE|nr:Putative methylesterase 6 [Vanrija pseudolonga]
MAPKPTIILVHGFWGGAAHWNKVILELRAAGYGYNNLRAIDVPLTSLADDAGRIRQELDNTEGDVLLVGHSYGGAVITEAGNHKAVKGLVYIAAFAPDAGESPGGLTQARPPSAAANLAPDAAGYLWVKRELFHESFAQDLTKDDGFAMAITQKAPLASTFGEAISNPAWKTKPSWYQISTADHMINPENQQFMSARIQPRKVIKLDASHASLASKPKEVAALILEAAGAI